MPALSKATRALVRSILLCIALLTLLACSTTNDRASSEVSGHDAFVNRCSGCHGFDAQGTTSGPPLVHRLYEIGHHPDFSFRNAVKNGVTSHHWEFGDMPAIPDVPDAEVEAIICHVRDLQRTNGINAGTPC